MARVLNTGDRAEQARHISIELPAHVGLLQRLLRRELGEQYSYTEARVLSSLADGPQRITDLAASEGLAQSTTTLLVKRLEEQGLLRRERQTDDERVVLVWLTDAGEAALQEVRARAAAGLRRHLDAMPDRQLKALATATDALAELIKALQSDASSDGARE